MLIVQVDGVDAEALQRCVAGVLHVLRRSIHAEERPVISAHVAELGGNHDLRAPITNCRTQQSFVLEWAIHVGGVEEGHAHFDGAMNGGDRFGFVAPRVKLRHAHATETKGRD